MLAAENRAKAGVTSKEASAWLLYCVISALGDGALTMLAPLQALAYGSCEFADGLLDFPLEPAMPDVNILLLS